MLRFSFKNQATGLADLIIILQLIFIFCIS